MSARRISMMVLVAGAAGAIPGAAESKPGPAPEKQSPLRLTIDSRTGSLDEQVVRQAVSPSGLRASCADGAWPVRLKLTLSVLANGIPVGVYVSGTSDDALRRCIKEQVAALRFPKSDATTALELGITWAPPPDATRLGIIRGGSGAAIGGLLGTTGLGIVGSRINKGSGLTVSEIDRALRRQSSALRACKLPGGGVRVRLEIADRGRVRSASARAGGLTPATRQCVVGLLRKLRFPRRGAASEYRARLHEIGSAGAWGYGMKGVGPGGGGSGWGTIGTGRYGRIGHGSGSGSGYGRGSGSRSRGPQITMGKAASVGALDKNIIRRVIRRKISHVRYCYEKRLTSNPKLSGTVVTRFTIGVDGKVVSPAVSGLGDRDLHACIERALRSIRFPKPKNGGEVNVRYPFTLRPSGR